MWAMTKGLAVYAAFCAIAVLFFVLGLILGTTAPY